MMRFFHSLFAQPKVDIKNSCRSLLLLCDLGVLRGKFLFQNYAIDGGNFCQYCTFGNPSK